MLGTAGVAMDTTMSLLGAGWMVRGSPKIKASCIPGFVPPLPWVTRVSWLCRHPWHGVSTPLLR